MKCYYCENFDMGYCHYMDCILSEAEIEWNSACEGANEYVNMVSDDLENRSDQT